ncbi:hypothetical protein C6P46_005853 [Rhodotorula mucilaginosa]|uniref:Uncharacterized protein n=1 Tax=Rhodotorula mucilaginosa TaxID=5537 RepID=A0A9P6VZU6_RHOMI|nr:hypothetical protein C6P46_005853 [Rhodotorula mucilaginosa]
MADRENVERLAAAANLAGLTPLGLSAGVEEWHFPQLIQRFLDVGKCLHAGLDADQIPALNKRTLTALKTPFILCKTSEGFPHMVVNAYEVEAPPPLHPKLQQPTVLRWWPGPSPSAEAETDTSALLTEWNAGTLIQRNKPYSLDLHGFPQFGAKPFGYDRPMSPLSYLHHLLEHCAGYATGHLLCPLLDVETVSNPTLILATGSAACVNPHPVYLST